MNRTTLHEIRSLRHRNSRMEQNRFVVEGVKAIEELNMSELEVERIYCVERMKSSIPIELHSRAETVSSKDMERISQMSTSPGILAVVVRPTNSAEAVLSHIQNAPVPFGLVASDIQDPGNLGTLIRSADWFGFGGVFVTEGTTDPWSSKCVQASMGSIFRVPIANWTSNHPHTERNYHLELEGIDYHQMEWQPGLVWVGSESHGFEHIAVPKGSTAVHIPRIGPAESLNAGVAGSIVCAEISRVWRLKRALNER